MRTDNFRSKYFMAINVPSSARLQEQTAALAKHRANGVPGLVRNSGGEMQHNHSLQNMVPVAEGELATRSREPSRRESAAQQPEFQYDLSVLSTSI